MFGKLKTYSRCRKFREPSQMTCVKNPLYNPCSKIYCGWILLVTKVVSNRELQVDRMCSSLLFLIFMETQVFFRSGSNGIV